MAHKASLDELVLLVLLALADSRVLQDLKVLRVI